MRKLVKFLTSRMVLVALVILLQLVWIFSSLLRLSRYYVFISAVFSVIGIIMVIYIVRQWINPAYKLAWAILILGVPLVGVILYLLFGRASIKEYYFRQHEIIASQIRPMIRQDESVLEEVRRKNSLIANDMRYTFEQGGYPVYRNTETEYLPIGEMFFERLCEELEKAEHFIFIESFIIARGYMWGTVLDILKRKAAEGVEVRILYDDMGCIWLLPFRYEKKLEKMGIQCRCFNHIVPFLSAIMNNRDHRKIIVVDGHTCFMGGINLADEYINRIRRFGHWKDSGICLKGDAVWNSTAMFLEMWNSIEETDTDYMKYMPHVYHPEPFESDGYVQPYGDSPLDHECTGENVYLNAIHHAQRYIYFYTPYLIIDNELMTSLTLAAKSGVDVRIMTPHIPDKKMIFMLTRSYYGQLMAAGVRIYEYLPGFLHAKCCICDDKVAIVGSINLDYRSLYLHFECAAYLYETKAVSQLKADFDETLERTVEITGEFLEKRPWYEKGLQACMRLFAPLL